MPRAHAREPARPDARVRADTRRLSVAKRGRRRGGCAGERVRPSWVQPAAIRRSERAQGRLAGRTTPAPRTAAVMAVTNVGLDWLELLPSDDAQQLSAWACVRTRADPERCESPLCIGHSAPSAQQAMRASGVASQPAHRAALPARSPAARRTADRRLRRVGTAPKDAGVEPKCQSRVKRQQLGCLSRTPNPPHPNGASDSRPSGGG